MTAATGRYRPATFGREEAERAWEALEAEAALAFWMRLPPAERKRLVVEHLNTRESEETR